MSLTEHLEKTSIRARGCHPLVVDRAILLHRDSTFRMR